MLVCWYASTRLLVCQRVQRNHRPPDVDFILHVEDGTSSVAMVATTAAVVRLMCVWPAGSETKSLCSLKSPLLLRLWTYALQRVKDAFRANRSVEDPKMVAKLVEEGHKTLALIKRQVSIGKLYETQKNIVEGVGPH
ncbi:unnamed protein product [Lota lota]